jgi:hypothetical protein
MSAERVFGLAHAQNAKFNQGRPAAQTLIVHAHALEVRTDAGTSATPMPQDTPADDQGLEARGTAQATDFGGAEGVRDARDQR